MKQLLRSITAFSLIAIFFIANITYAEGLYPSSVVGTDFDYITKDDSNTFLCMEYDAYKQFEMPDKRSGSPSNIVQDAYIFTAYFTDGTQVKFAMDQDFKSKIEAEENALRYTSRLGKLPTLYRSKINHVVVHKGGVDTTAFAEDLGHFLVVYSDNAIKRIATNDLEETFFHEGTHAAIQSIYINTPEWKSAQVKDGAVVTNYAATNDKEDFAESALFAYTVINNPERFPTEDLVKIKNIIPNRIKFFEELFKAPITYNVGNVYTCSNNAKYPKDVPAEENLIVPVSETTPPTSNPNVSVPSSQVERPLNFIIFDALVSGFGKEESKVGPFTLEQWNESKNYTDDELIAATMDEFSIDESTLKTEIEKWRYFNDKSVNASEVSPTRNINNVITSQPLETNDVVTKSIINRGKVNPIFYTIALLLGILVVLMTVILIVLVKHTRNRKNEIESSSSDRI